MEMVLSSVCLREYCVPVFLLWCCLLGESLILQDGVSVTKRSQNKCTQSRRLAVLRGMGHQDGLFTESGLDSLPWEFVPQGSLFKGSVRC